jgi:hypothetical protein
MEGLSGRGDWTEFSFGPGLPNRIRGVLNAVFYSYECHGPGAKNHPDNFDHMDLRISGVGGLTMGGGIVIWHVLYRLSKLAIVTALAFSIGLHWGFLQSVAWVGMVVSYSHDGSFGEALEKTFDGKHPCALCKAIAKGKKSDRKSEYPAAGKKLEFSYSRAVFVFCAPTHFLWEVGGLDERPDSANSPPPVPPPKAVLG